MTELPYWPPLVALALGILAIGFAWYRSKTFEDHKTLRQHGD